MPHKYFRLNVPAELQVFLSVNNLHQTIRRGSCHEKGVHTKVAMVSCEHTRVGHLKYQLKIIL